MIHSRHLLSRRCMSSLTERFRTVNNPGNCLHPITAPKVNSQSFPNVSHFPQGLGPLFNLAPRLQTALEPAMRSEITSKQVEELASFSQAAWGYEAKKETKEKGKVRTNTCMCIRVQWSDLQWRCHVYGSHLKKEDAELTPHLNFDSHSSFVRLFVCSG
jgi:hypothetical protein